VVVGPSRGRHRCSVKSIFGRPRRNEHNIVTLRQQDYNRTAQACMDLAGSAFRHGIECRQSGQTPCKFVQSAHRTHAAPRNSCLFPHATGQCRTDDGDDQKNYQCQQFIRLGNRECIERRDEEKIIDEE